MEVTRVFVSKEVGDVTMALLVSINHEHHNYQFSNKTLANI